MIASRFGPDTPDCDMVICPNCTSQFVAIPVNVQARPAAEALLVRWIRANTDVTNLDEIDDRIDAHLEAK